MQDAPDCSQAVTWCWEWAAIKEARWWPDFSGEVPAENNTRYDTSHTPPACGKSRETLEQQ